MPSKKMLKGSDQLIPEIWAGRLLDATEAADAVARILKHESSPRHEVRIFTDEEIAEFLAEDAKKGA